MFAGALSIALPAMTALLIVNLAFGVMSRAAPQLNIFSIGFPLSLILGFVALWMTISGLAPQAEGLIQQGLDLMRHLSGGGR
jgi:flagellar biosynthetic protein FliR